MKFAYVIKKKIPRRNEWKQLTRYCRKWYCVQTKLALTHTHSLYRLLKLTICIVSLNGNALEIQNKIEIHLPIQRLAPNDQSFVSCIFSCVDKVWPKKTVRPFYFWFFVFLLVIRFFEMKPRFSSLILKPKQKAKINKTKTKKSKKWK